MVDYKNGKIYVIRNHVNDKVYVGSTTRALSKRMADHRDNSKKHPERCLYTAFKEIGVDQFYIELVENYPCDNTEQLRKREGEVMRKYNSHVHGYNVKVAGRSLEEYLREDVHKERVKTYYQENKNVILERVKDYRNQHQDEIRQKQLRYRQDNKEQIAAKKKEYYRNNKDTIINKGKELVVCGCGSEVTQTSP